MKLLFEMKCNETLFIYRTYNSNGLINNVPLKRFTEICLMLDKRLCFTFSDAGGSGISPCSCFIPLGASAPLVVWNSG